MNCNYSVLACIGRRISKILLTGKIIYANLATALKETTEYRPIEAVFSKVDFQNINL